MLIQRAARINNGTGGRTRREIYSEYGFTVLSDVRECSHLSEDVTVIP